MIEVVETRWMGHLAFEANIDGFHVKMDTSPQHGGTGFGPRPKPMVLSSLAGCTGMDVVSILTKKRVEFAGLKIIIN
ncbi:MAG: OsmC family protein [bacterium]